MGHTQFSSGCITVNLPGAKDLWIDTVRDDKQVPIRFQISVSDKCSQAKARGYDSATPLSGDREYSLQNSFYFFSSKRRHTISPEKAREVIHHIIYDWNVVEFSY